MQSRFLQQVVQLRDTGTDCSLGGNSLKLYTLSFFFNSVDLKYHVDAIFGQLPSKNMARTVPGIIVSVHLLKTL